MRILITGGAGFIGSNLINKIQEVYPEARLAVIDNLIEAVHGKNPTTFNHSIERFVIADILDFESLTSLVDDFKPEIVYHLAAETGTGTSLSNPELHLSTNIVGTLKLLQSLGKTGNSLKKVVLTSSRAVYGEGPWINKQTRQITYPKGRTISMLKRHEWDYPGMKPLGFNSKTSIPNPCSIYGATKLSQESLISAWASANSVQFSCFRLQNVYGPGQSPINPYTGITMKFINQALSKNSITVFEDGLITRDFVFISDVVDSLMEPLKSDHDGIFDVGSGEQLTILRVAEIINKACNGAGININSEYRLGDVRFAALQENAIPSTPLEKKPVNFEEGLVELLSWLSMQDQFEI
jgi:dTDP-L-rhamnose 4-epimerase